MNKGNAAKGFRSSKKKIGIDEVEITEDFAEALRLMEETAESLFITGKAGTGKSTLLRYFRAKTQKNIAVVAPTGIAAINVEGQTIHSFFRLPPTFIQEQDVRRLDHKSRAVIDRLDILIVDEVSMVRADVMDGIDWALKSNRGSSEPFGGVQVILFGDLHQLAPVVDRNMGEFFDKKYATPYFFSAQVFKAAGLRHIELGHIFRQRDAEFIRILNNIRDHEHTFDDLETINARVAACDDPEDSSRITLTATNSAAFQINAANLTRIRKTGRAYRANVTGKFDEKEFPNDFELALKVGSQVMMVKNDTVEKRWVNGSLGKVVELGDDSIKVRIGRITHDVDRVKWEKIRYVYNEDTDHVEPESIGSFEQYPLKLAWAITIHKSQGQTFDRVAIDTGSGAFSHGQIYVALSRCASLEGIVLKRPITPRDIIFDRRVLDFYNKTK